MSDNLALWQSVEKTPVQHTKEITGKSYRGNSPKPHYLIHKATETFGPCGIGWGFTIEDERIEEGAEGSKLHIARVKVWYEWNGKRGEVEHIGGTEFSGFRSSGKPFTDEDAPKKSVTYALVKALSMIGFAGDIFMGRYDDSKYVSDLRQEAANEAKAAAAQVDEQKAKGPSKSDTAVRKLYSDLQSDMRRCQTSDDLGRWWRDAECVTLRAKLPEDWQRNLRQQCIDLGSELSAASETVRDIQDTFPGASVTNERVLSPLEAG